MGNEVVLAIFSDAWDKGVFGDNDEDKDIDVIWDEEKGCLKDLGITLLREYLIKLYPGVRPMAVEQRFQKSICDITLSSTLDLITDTQIIDHKTAKRRKSQLDADKALQPLIHMYVSGTPAGTPYSYHQLLKLKVPTVDYITTKRTPDKFKWLEEELLPPIIKMIQGGIFPPSGINSYLCSPDYCSYYTICQGY